MTEKTDWEVIDGPIPHQRYERHARHARQPVPDFMRTLFGKWWRWKVAGVTLVVGIALAFFAALAGVIVLGVVTAAAVSLGIARIRHWLRGGGSGPGAGPVSPWRPPHY